VVDACAPNDGFPLAFAFTFLATNGPASAGVVPATAVVVLRHTAFPLALDHTMWQKYKIGQSLSILDPETKAPAVKNAFLRPKPGVLTLDEMAIDRLLANGAVIGACAIALKMGSGKLAKNADMSAEEAAKEWAANVIPGITVIPSGRGASIEPRSTAAPTAPGADPSRRRERSQWERRYCASQPNRIAEVSFGSFATEIAKSV
jgi:hypothetical protein